MEATLGGGCFWCLEAIFQELRGVVDVTPGYAGGHDPDPTYERVCSGTTGHAEVVRVRFDTEVLSYRDLLTVFFHIHDPTTPDRQGADVGTQYRSIVLAHDEEQRAVAEEVVRDVEAEGVWKDPIVTEVVTLERFYPAEDYHRDYFLNHREQPYCQVVIQPKLAAFRRKFTRRRS